MSEGGALPVDFLVGLREGLLRFLVILLIIPLGGYLWEFSK
jgi:hypothetical protein